MKDFIQQGPILKNTFRHDLRLQNLIQKKFSVSDLATITKHLDHVGELAVTDWLSWGLEAQKKTPQHIPFSPWGERIDHIEMAQGWKNLEASAATEGIVATAYERKYGPQSRLYQMSLLYLYSSSSAFCSCPLAMTDGAARAIELSKDAFLKERAFTHLTSRDPKQFWTSGQWMTERTGGSDVSHTSTSAEKIDDLHYKLSGTKWFTSATTSQMALTLARADQSIEGNKGLSMFYLELRDENNKLNQIEVHRLKDKLGTKALPTAELSLHGTKARLVGKIGEGVKTIATVLNVTRLYNSICALSHMRRALDLAWDYSKKRKAFGAYLVDLPLHQATLQSLEAEFAKCFDLTFFAVELLGQEETGAANDTEKVLLRSLTPLVKLYTAKKAIEISSEVIEVFGGAGYVEDAGISYLLRDAQVFSIWEGTTNVLSMDFIRVCEKESALEVFQNYFSQNFKSPEDFLGLKSKVHPAEARALAFAVVEKVIQSLRKKDGYFF